MQHTMSPGGKRSSTDQPRSTEKGRLIERCGRWLLIALAFSLPFEAPILTLGPLTITTVELVLYALLVVWGPARVDGYGVWGSPLGARAGGRRGPGKNRAAVSRRGRSRRRALPDRDRARRARGAHISPASAEVRAADDRRRRPVLRGAQPAAIGGRHAGRRHRHRDRSGGVRGGRHPGDRPPLHRCALASVPTPPLRTVCPVPRRPLGTRPRAMYWRRADARVGSPRAARGRPRARAGTTEATEGKTERMYDRTGGRIGLASPGR